MDENNEMVTIECQDHMTVTATRKQWEDFLDAQIKMYDERILAKQGKDMRVWQRREKKAANG